ncbi:hypothetical protein LCGC14_0263910 [marine sediment metagenome]|uniref:Uncharacterized protein n=1 Tax=marine sediment metagenome TaxID=412755 RepID=A0A0F9UHM7_9ZZZZ
MMPIGVPLTAVWLYDDSASDFTDNTIEAQSDGGTTFELLGETADKRYFGFSRRIDALMFVLNSSGSYGALTWDYGATADSWIQFVPTRTYRLFDNTSGYMLWDVNGSTIDTAWASFALTTSSPHTASSVPDSTARYWVRVGAASVATAATVESVLCRPYASYASAADVQNQLQLTTAFSSSTTPSLFTVEDYLRGAEDNLVYLMGKSWRVEFIENEAIQFKMYGMKTRYEPIIDMYELAVWNGGSFDVKTDGRDKDFLIDNEMGMLYVATVFLDAMPPNFRRSYTLRREQGSFKRAVRVNYSWGYDQRKHPLGQHVRRIVAKQACIDIVTDLDFAPLIPLGLDTVDLQTKVDNWSRDVTEFKDTYRKLRVA